MAQGCEHENSQGVKCGLPLNHHGGHQAYQQSVEPDPFCLRATDPFTLALIRAWISAASAQGVTAAKIQSAEEHYAAIKRWQDGQGTRLPG